MQPLNEYRKLAARHNVIKYRFILAELDLALTFCDVALASDDRMKSKRNAENARRAYDSATHFLVNTDFSDRMKAIVAKKVTMLKRMLRRVERHRYAFAASETGGTV